MKNCLFYCKRTLIDAIPQPTPAAAPNVELMSSIKSRTCASSMRCFRFFYFYYFLFALNEFVQTLCLFIPGNIKVTNMLNINQSTCLYLFSNLKS